MFNLQIFCQSASIGQVAFQAKKLSNIREEK